MRLSTRPVWASMGSEPRVAVGLGPKGEGGVVRETSDRYQEPEDLDERDLEIARADSVADVFRDAADELVAAEAGSA